MFSKQGFFTVCLVILAALLITGCTTPTPVAVTGVTLNHATMTLIAGGATGTLVKTVAPADATDKSVTWSSSATAVATVSVNGVVTPLTAGTTTITVTTVDGSKTATCAVTVTSVVAIATAAIAGVTAPVTGATPVATITATTAYTATIAWSGSPVTFAGGTIYTATITITPKVGYTLTGVAANFFTVAGAAATNAANSGVVTAVFPATATAVTVVTLAVIAGVTAPVTGAVPVTTITATAQYTGTVTWSPAAATFAESTVYTATITLTAKIGYTLTGVAANFFTVAGTTSDTNPANSGVVTAVFPATAAPVIATVSTIANAAVAPTVAVTGTNFKATIAASDLTVGVGTTGLTFSGVIWVNATHITVAFTGTAAAGNVTIQAKTSAFTPAAVAASNTLTVTVSAVAAAVLTGTVITGAPNTEANIVAGGKTIIITLTNDTWIAGTGVGGVNYAVADANTIIDGLATTTDTTEWAKVIAALKLVNNGIDNTAVVRTSATVLTITLPATAGYNISASQNQTVTMTVPAASVAGVSAIVAAPTFVITADVAAAVLSGTVTAATTEANIVAGGKTIIITLTNDTWIAGTGASGAYTDAEALVIINGLAAGDQTAEWTKVKDALIAASAAGVNTAVVRTSDTVLTITLPATAGYNIATNQTVTMTVPAASVAGVSAIVAAPTFVITII